MIVSLLYKMTWKVLSAASVLLRGETARDAELLVLRHENTVLRRGAVGPEGGAEVFGWASKALARLKICCNLADGQGRIFRSRARAGRGPDGCVRCGLRRRSGHRSGVWQVLVHRFAVSVEAAAGLQNLVVRPTVPAHERTSTRACVSDWMPQG